MIYIIMFEYLDYYIYFIYYYYKKMRVRIKLRDMGVKKQPKVWLIVQPAKKNLKGKYLDRIGVVHP